MDETLEQLKEDRNFWRESAVMSGQQTENVIAVHLDLCQTTAKVLLDLISAEVPPEEKLRIGTQWGDHLKKHIARTEQLVEKLRENKAEAVRRMAVKAREVN